MRTLPVILLAATIFMTLSSSCSFTQTPSSEKLTVVSYNVQALFDEVDDGDEFEGYSLTEGWSDAHYRERLKRVSSSLIQYTQETPSIIVLQEIENENVVEDLISHDLGKRGFLYYTCTDSIHSPIETAVISRYPITESHIHSLEEFRDILEAVIDVEGERIRIYALHLRSRREGGEESEQYRIAQIRCLKHVMERNFTHHDVLPTVIAGDFNESADQHERIGGAYQSALIPFDALKRKEWEENGSLVITSGYPSEGTFHSFHLDEDFPCASEAEGSYCYNGVWESYDQILLSNDFFDSFGYEFVSGGVITHPSLLTEKGTPFRYVLHTHKGVSDHLPVYVSFKRGY